MKITNIHPAYESSLQRAERLTDLKAACREKLSAPRKPTAKAG